MKICYNIVLIFLLTCFGNKGWGQTASYLGIDGGFEGSATIDNTATGDLLPRESKWVKANTNATIANETGTVRSGSNSLKVSSSTSTTCRVWSPLITGFSASTTKWVVQYYRRATSTTATIQNQSANYRGTVEALSGTYTTISAINTWEKVTYAPTSVLSVTQGAAGIMVKMMTSAGDMYYDDFCLYESSSGADVTAPDPPTASNVANPTTSTLDVSWTAPGTGVDGGGYLVVRGTADPTTAPNINGIYAVGNLIAAGMTVAYQGTSTSFIDNGLASGTTYYYRIYTYDKAYNYPTALTGNGTTSSGNSTSSDIIANAAFTYPTNIAYASYQSANIIADANDIEVAKFDIRDGGGAADGDALTTSLTAITFSVTNSVNLRRVAIYDGATERAELAAGASVVFTGLTGLSAADNGSKTFSIRASFLSTVTDNQQFQFTVTSAAADGAGSTFATADAGGASSSITGDANRIEVTATQLGYVQQPSNTAINVAMSPAVTVEAKDANNNRDLDFTSSIRITSTGTLTGTPVDVAASSGLATFSTLTHTVSGTGFTLNAERQATLDWDITSSTFDITVVPVTIVNWDFPSDPDDAIADGGIAANSAKTISSSGTSAISYSFGGATTNGARATGWDAGSGTKYWQIEFVTTNYNTLKLSSKQRSSATGPRDFKAQYKIGAGGTWTDITGATSIVVADNYTTGVLSDIALPIECENQPSVYIRWIMTTDDDASPPGSVASTGVSNIDDIIITGIFYSCSAPITQASSITFSNVTSVSMTVNWVRGAPPGEGVIVLAKAVSAVDSDPGDGTTYTANSVFGSGTQLGTGNYVVFMGSGTSVNLSGLTPGTTYYFKVYEYNCTGADSKFNITAPPSNNQTTTSCSTPTTQASNITFSAIGSSQMTVGWTNGNGEKRIVIINTSNSFTDPINGTDPSANSIYGGAGEQVVYNNSGTSVTVTGLTSSTTYWFRSQRLDFYHYRRHLYYRRELWHCFALVTI